MALFSRVSTAMATRDVEILLVRPSARPSVCLSRSGIVLKRQLNILSYFLQHIIKFVRYNDSRQYIQIHI